MHGHAGTASAAMSSQSLLFITRKWAPAVGGMEIYSREMAQEFRQICETKVLSLPGRTDGRPPSAIALCAFFVRTAWYLLEHAKDHDCVLFGDLVLAPLAVICRLSSSRIRTGVAIHGSDVAYHIRSGVRPKLYRAYLYLIALLRWSMDVVIANSAATAHQAERIGIRHARVVPLGVRLGDLSEKRPVGRSILFVGRIARRKGAAWFADEVLPGLPGDIRLLVAGTGWDKHEVARLRGNQRVTMLGPVFGSELGKLRSRSLVVVVPNIPMDGRDFEGFGLVALEGAADGGIVLAANLDGISSAIVDGKTGFLLPPQDAKSWQEKIRSILHWGDEQRASFIDAARSHLAGEFSWEATACKTMTALSSADSW
jgi:glycosyltransferase involved in cell wall biosynthesis